MEFIYKCKAFLNGKEESWLGTICPLLPFDCTEYQVSARGSCFHLIIGRHWNSRYIYIPTWNVSMDISYLDDCSWNREHLQQNYPELSAVDVISIVEALAAISKHYNLENQA